MNYQVNPLKICVRNQDEITSEKPWWLFIGDPRKVTSYLHKRDKEGEHLMILFSHKWYEVDHPEMETFFFLCPHLKRKGLWLRIKYFFLLRTGVSTDICYHYSMVYKQVCLTVLVSCLFFCKSFLFMYSLSIIAYLSIFFMDSIFSMENIF